MVQLVAERLLDREDRALRVELDVAVGVVVRIEIAEQQVGVGDRGPQAAPVVAGRSRVRAGRLRADLDGVVNPVVGRDGAAARTERVQVHHRHRDQPAVDRRQEVIVLDAALGDQADVERGAAHIGGDDVAQPGLARKMLRRTDTGDRAGMDCLQRVGGVHLRHAAGVVDHQHRLVVTEVAQVVRQLAERVEHDLVQEGVDDRRRRADVLALAAGHLVAQQDRDGAQLVQRELLEDDLLDLQLVLGVLGGVGQRDHDRLGARVDERPSVCDEPHRNRLIY